MHPGKNKTNWNERRKEQATTSANAHALLFPHPRKTRTCNLGYNKKQPCFSREREKGRIWSSGGICRKEVWSQNTKRRSSRLIRPRRTSSCVCTYLYPNFFLLFSGKSLIEGSWKKKEGSGNLEQAGRKRKFVPFVGNYATFKST